MGSHSRDKGKKHNKSSMAGSSAHSHRERSSDVGENVQYPGQPASSSEGSGGYFMDVQEQDPHTGHVMIVRRFFKSDAGPAEFLHDQGLTMAMNQPYSTGNDVFDNGAASGSRPNYPPIHLPRKFVQGKVGRAMQAWPPNPSGFEGGQADLAASYPTSHAGSDAGGLPLGAEYTNPAGLGPGYYDSAQVVSYAFGGAGVQGHWVNTEQTLWCSCAQLVQCRCTGGMSCRCLTNLESDA